MTPPKIYGLIGYPLKHSFSPAMHNAAFKALNIDAEYRLFELKIEELRRFFKSLTAKNICGFNVTIPYKEGIKVYLNEITEEASLIGAVNTVKIEGDKKIGYNTDSEGFLRHLMDVYKSGFYNKTAFLIGAGGAAKAVAYSLAKMRVGSIIIYDKLTQRARALSKKINDNFKSCGSRAVDSMDELLKVNPDLLVNATPVGMEEADPLLIDPDKLTPRTFVYDLIYNPAQTKLLRLARDKGCGFSNGLGMLLYQGMLSFEKWTGKNAPQEVMRRALEEKLKNAKNNN